MKKNKTAGIKIPIMPTNLYNIGDKVRTFTSFSSTLANRFGDQIATRLATHKINPTAMNNIHKRAQLVVNLPNHGPSQGHDR